MYYVYILASRRNGTLYVGVTNDLVRRVFEHKNDVVERFTKRYGVLLLVYYESTSDVASAIQREWIPVFTGMTTQVSARGPEP